MVSTRKNQAKLPTENSRTQRQMERDLQKLQQAEDEARLHKEENDRLKAQLLVAQASSASKGGRKSGRKSEMTKEEREWANLVTAKTKEFVWGSIIFCNSEEKLIKISASVFDQWDLKEYRDLTPEELQKAKTNWIANNKDLVRNGINEARNYAQSQLRNYVVDTLAAGGRVPTPEEVFDCATREPYLHEQEDKHWIFDCYHDVLLFRVVGKDFWDTGMRHYNTIAKAVLPVSKKPAIPVIIEAFLVVLFENCYPKWVVLANLKKAGKKGDLDRKSPQAQVPFIVSDAGRTEWGGWNQGGREEVVTMSKKIRSARERDHAFEMENDCLKRLRIVYEVEEKDKKRKKRGKRKLVVPHDDSDLDEFENI
jgi:hypothetical protein